MIELEEICLACPNLSLVTKEYGIGSDGKPLKVHECKHIFFCRDFRKAQEEKDEDEQHVSGNS